MIPVRRHRIVSRGQLPDSKGGVYNPGAIRDGDSIVLLCRREVDYSFSSAVYPEVVVVDRGSLRVVSHRTLQRNDGFTGHRIEDFRIIDFGPERLVTHTVVTPSRIKPAISRLVADRLEPFDLFDLPIRPRSVEKNWSLFEHRGCLHCLYSLDPLTIFVRHHDRKWQLVKAEDNGWSSRLGGSISNSTNLIPFDDGYLGFWHTRIDGRYVQGAFHLDQRLSIAAVTGVLLDGAEIRDGFKPGVLYVSALVEDEGRILAFYGEADSHVGVAIIDRHDLARELMRSPFAAVPSLRLRYEGTTIGDVFRAARALREWSEERGHPRIRLFVQNEPQVPGLHLLEARNVTIGRLHDDQPFEARLLGRVGKIVWEVPPNRQ